MWRPIPGFEKYEAHPDGRIRNAATQCLKATCANRKGYHYVGVSDAHCHQHFKTVHRLIARTFLGKPPIGRYEIAHFNGDPSDNRVDNLRYASAKENQADRIRHGTLLLGERHQNAILTEAQVREMVANYVPRDPQFGSAAFARRFGVSRYAVQRIAQGRAWRHVTGGRSLTEERRIDHA